MYQLVEIPFFSNSSMAIPRQQVFQAVDSLLLSIRMCQRAEGKIFEDTMHD